MCLYTLYNVHCESEKQAVQSHHHFIVAAINLPWGPSLPVYGTKASPPVNDGGGTHSCSAFLYESDDYGIN